ncbi:hypothetical protein N7474_002285 [Penicillium riverlandense]|uniref:uncharacterized protein n=1 Tax=Penicillium riverlandense TaxID=1903569 RepID=UPI00254847C2|nr:uncharacterized protein N7474_002285 [Penicillium riverlandense]KAJ5833974.1 hypothetical protein N7474_002285 [Penicillium riverlandense]
MLEMMAAKGLITTVVLDCCHSGSVTRHVDQESVRVRGIQWDSAVAAVDARPINFAGNARNANVSRHWLLDPKGYTLLAACGPHELASEHRFEDGKVHGVLTYWMVYALSTLINGGSELTYRSLHEFIRSKLHAKWPHQNPMRFGMGESPFLGVKKLKQMSFAHVTDSLGHGRVRLNVGRAHGVCIDDEYAVYPFSPEMDKENSGSEEPPIIKIDTVTALTSTATAISDISTSTNIEVGWHAKPLTHFSMTSALVKVPDDFGIDENLRIGIHRTWLRLTSGCAKDETASFIIATNSGNEYQVFDAANQPIENVPTVPSSNDKAKHQVLAIVEHLAKFKFVEGLENRNPVQGFDNSFTIELSEAGSGTIGITQIKDQGTLSLIFRNVGDKALYFSVYNLKASWAIEGLFSDAGQFRVVKPGESSPVRLMMSIPDEYKAKGQTSIEDILKVFITAKPTTFEVLEMPEISRDENIASKTLRGGSGRLSTFLASLAIPQRDARVVKNDEAWATRNFLIRTTAE